jgi:hypothetical protein
LAELGADRKHEKVGNLVLFISTSVLIVLSLRSLLTLQLLDVILDFDIGSVHLGSRRDFFQIPLPCSRAIWDAGTSFDWEKEYKKCEANGMSGKLLVVGDLEELRARPVEEVDSNVAAALISWVGEMDGFGRLLFNGTVGLWRERKYST